MTRLGWLLAGVGGLLLIGCAQPGTTAGDDPDDGASPSSPSATTDGATVEVPTVGVSDCFGSAAQVSAPPSAAAAPWPTGTGPDEQLERNQRANDMFRERAQLPAEYHVAAEPCLDEVRAELATLHAAGDYEAASVEEALRRVGLSEPYARPPGRLDRGAGDGVVFSASPGAGCIVGRHGPNGSIVEYGGMIYDGGCLVAPG